MPVPTDQTMIDVAIIGGGPAGSASARLLASWGHSVALFNKPTTGPTLAESIPPSARKLFHAFGINGAIGAAGFTPWRGNVVWWGNERRIEPFSGGEAGVHVIRSDFDRLLRSLAAERGAAVHEAPATGLTRCEDEDFVHVEIDGRPPLAARFALDCSGRAGVLARAFHLRQADGGTRTIALTSVFHRDGGWAELNPAYTVVESYDDGWLWSVPIGNDRRYVTVMVDPQATDLQRGGAEAVFRHELAKAEQYASALKDAALVAGPWGSDASLYTAARFSGPNFLLVGDAASSLDPLSSVGVKKALASAWLASIVVHTSLERPTMRSAAVQFFECREREMYASFKRLSGDFSRAAAEAHAHPFWLRRGARALDDPDGDLALRLRDDPDVQRAFMHIRRSPRLELRRSARATIEPRPGISGREIVMQPSLVCPNTPEGLRYLRGVDLPHVIELAPSHEDAGTMFDSYNRARAPVALPDFLGALAVLMAWGVLEERHESRGN